MKTAGMLRAAAGAAGGGGGGGVVLTSMTHRDTKMSHATSQTSATVTPTPGSLLVMLVSADSDVVSWTITPGTLGGTWTPRITVPSDVAAARNVVYTCSDFNVSGTLDVASAAGTYLGFIIDEAVGDIDMTDPFVQTKVQAGGDTDLSITFDVTAVGSGYWAGSPSNGSGATVGAGMTGLGASQAWGVVKTAWTTTGGPLTVMPVTQSAASVGSGICGGEFRAA